MRPFLRLEKVTWRLVLFSILLMWSLTRPISIYERKKGSLIIKKAFVDCIYSKVVKVEKKKKIMESMEINKEI